jgi:hypothetical protein
VAADLAGLHMLELRPLLPPDEGCEPVRVAPKPGKYKVLRGRLLEGVTNAGVPSRLGTAVSYWGKIQPFGPWSVNVAIQALYRAASSPAPEV